MKKILFISLILIILSACSNKKLDRNLAFQLINKQNKYPNVEVINFPGITSSKKLNNDYYDLRANKLIKEQRKGKWGDNFYVLLTQKGLPYYYSGKPNYNGYKLASNLVELKEITGIKFIDGKNTASIEYNTVRKEITPFGKTKNQKEGDIKNHSVIMELYDDGWRITSKKNKTLLKSDFPLLYEKEKIDNFFKNFDDAIASKNKEKINEMLDDEVISGIQTYFTPKKISRKEFWETNKDIFKPKYEKEEYIGVRDILPYKFRKKLNLDNNTHILLKKGFYSDDEEYLSYDIYFKLKNGKIKILGYYREWGVVEPN